VVGTASDLDEGVLAEVGESGGDELHLVRAGGAVEAEETLSRLRREACELHCW
jgi:hypothetical protein